MREPTSRSPTPIQTTPPAATDGLGRLDQDRALSLADEGGVSAAGLESQEKALGWYRGDAGRALALFGVAALTFWTLRRALRS